MQSGPDAILDFSVIDESDDYLVVSKPAPLIVHPSNGRIEPTLLGGIEELLAYEVANGKKPAIITRLDRETSGVVLIAKHTQAARELSMALQNRIAQKEYLAIVHGWPDWQEKQLDAAIIRKGLVMESAIWLRRIVHPQGSSSLTHFHVIRKWQNQHGNFSLIRCYPITGRTHQIRVHLEHLGHPIVGDKIYGRDDQTFLQHISGKEDTQTTSPLLMNRHALHASQLSIPWNDQTVQWNAPLASDMEAFILA